MGVGDFCSRSEEDRDWFGREEVAALKSEARSGLLGFVSLEDIGVVGDDGPWNWDDSSSYWDWRREIWSERAEELSGVVSGLRASGC